MDLIKFIKNIFAKEVNKKSSITNFENNYSEVNKKTPIQKNDYSDENAFDKSRELIKKATSYKKSDIYKAIELIEKSIKCCPEKVLSDYFKLANYYFLADKKKKAFEVHYQLLENFNPNDITMFNMNKTQIYDKLCILFYKDKNYEQYLYYYCLWLYNIIVSAACQGTIEHLINMINEEDQLKFLAPTKVNGCFRKLKKESNRQVFNNKLTEYLKDKKNILIEMAKIAHNIENKSDNDDFLYEATYGEQKNSLLRKNKKFIDHYNYVNSNDFVNFYSKELKFLLINSNSNSSNDITTTIKSNTINTNAIKSATKKNIYKAILIQRQGIQLLESITILNNTKNIDTLKGRFEFIKKMYDYFIEAYSNKRYISDIQIAIDEYKTMYYDKILKDFELSLIVKPSNQDLDLYYSKCLVNSFMLFYEEQRKQINSLKRKNAKERRLEKIVAVADETLNELRLIKDTSKISTEHIGKILIIKNQILDEKQQYSIR